VKSLIKTSLATALLAFQLNGAYWQQEVRYHIEVTLIDSNQTLTASEKLTYFNNSPDTLDGIWMHLWPNGYRNDKTALAQERMQEKHTRFINTSEAKRGWMDLGDVTADSVSILWRAKGDSIDIVWFELPEALVPGDSVLLDIPFQVKLPKLNSRLGYVGEHFEITQWYPKPAVYDATGWHPMPYRNWGEFYSEWGEFTVAITLPENYIVAATGELQTPSEKLLLDSLAIFGNSLLDSLEKNEGRKKPEPDTLNVLSKAKTPKSSSTTKTIIFNQKRIHDFAWVADKQFLVTHTTTTSVDSNRAPIDLWNFVLPKNFGTYRHGLKALKSAIDSCSAWFMPYPYAQCTVVDGDISAGGGMEYPMLTIINAVGWGELMDLTIFHEVAHNWFYGLAGFNERRFPWMDEGFTTYAEKRFTLAPKDSSEEDNEPAILKYLPFLNLNLMYDAPLYTAFLNNTDQPPNLPSDQFVGINYRYMVYDKPSVATMMLQHRVGQARMDEAWHDFFRQWAYKHPQPEDVRLSLETSLGMNLDWFFDGFIASRAKMDYGIGKVKSSPDDPSGWRTNLKLTNHGELTAPVPIVFRGVAENQIKTVWIDSVGTSQMLSVQTPFKPKSVVLDPDAQTLDMNRVNDGSGVHLKFIISDNFLNRGHGYTIRWLPGVWWNQRDGVLPAFWILHRKLDDPILQWRLSSQYGTKTKSWYESLSVKRRLDLAGVTQSFISARWMNNWYAPLVGFQSELTWQDPAVSHQTKVNVGLLYQDIKLEALTREFFDTRVWNAGKVVKLKFNIHQQKKQLDKTRSTDFGMIAGMASPASNSGISPNATPALRSGTTFLRWDASSHWQRKFSDRVKLNWNLFSAVVLGTTPLQERIYLSSSVDPNLESPLLLTRSGDHWLSPNDGLYLEQPVNIPGYGLAQSANAMVSAVSLIGTSLDINLGMPLKFLIAGGVGKATTSADWQAVGSFSPYLDLGPIPLQFVFPVAWLEDGKLTGGFQFQLNLKQHFTLNLGG